MAPDATADGPPPDAGGPRATTPLPPESVEDMGAPRRRDWPALAALGAVSAVWTATYLRHAWRHGRLGLPPLYDDVVYLLDGARRVASLRENGLVGLIGSLLEYPPTSLLSTVHATAAFLVFGVEDWAPYLFNGFVVFMILAAVERTMRGPAPAGDVPAVPGGSAPALPVWPRVAVCLLLLGSPMLGRAVDEFRPDFVAAFAVAAAAFTFFDRPLLGSRHRRLLLLGLLVGVSIAAKPRATPVALLMAGLAFGVGVLIDLADTPKEDRAARARSAAGWAALGAILLPILYAPFGAASTWNYVSFTVFGPGARLWTPQLTPGEGLVYYITGAGGQYMLGPYALPALGLALLGIAIRALRPDRSERWRAAASLALLIVAWAIPTFTPIKHGLYGLQFYALLLLVAARGAREVLAPLTARAPLALPFAAVIGAAAVWLGGTRLSVRAIDPRSPRNQEIHDLYDRMYAAMSHRLGPEGGDVLLTFTGFINKTNLTYRAVRDGRPLRFESGDGVDKTHRYGQRLKESELVLAMSPGTGHEIGKSPSLRILGEAIDMIDVLPEFERVAFFPVKHPREAPQGTPRYPLGYILYARRAGMQPTEGVQSPGGAPPP